MNANPIMKPRARDLARLRTILEDARNTKQPRCAEWLWAQIIELLEQAQERVEAGLWGQAQERLRVAAKKEREAKNVDIVEKYQAIFSELQKLQVEKAKEEVWKSIPEKVSAAVAKPEEPVFLVSLLTPEQEAEAIQLLKEEDEESTGEQSLTPDPHQEEVPVRTEATPDHPWVIAQTKREAIKAYWSAIITRKADVIFFAVKACKTLGLREVYDETLWQLEHRPLEQPHRIARLVAKDAWEMIP